MNLKHTATPWVMRAGSKSDHPQVEAFIEAPRSPSMAYGLDICGDDYTGYGGREQREANMEFIITACNSHEGLVNALKNILSAVASGSVGSILWDSVIRQGQEEIAKLEPKP